MSHWKFIPIYLLLPLSVHSAVAYFDPPQNWNCAVPKNMSPHVKVGFISPESSEFRPSINLALETVDLSLKEYLRAVKKIHLSQPNTSWRDLGRFQLAAGEGRLTEISSRSAWGDIKMLQAIFIQNQTAYILTAAVLKKDYAKQQKTLLKALQSLTLAPDLFTILPQDEQKEAFQTLFHSLSSSEEKSEEWKKDKWSALQFLVEKAGPQMGAHWQFLALQEGHQQIYNP
ncbi:MAG TPA: hypothetical protein DCE71_07345 [Parachlamydiales bacterium]|nr:hypothetical protein [Parachlamydiales bacterium]